MKHDYTLYKREVNKNTIWYFCYYDETGKRKYRSSGKTKKYEAEKVAQEFLGSLNSPASITLSDYTKTFFVWGECEWIKRQHARGRSFTEAVAKSRRSHLVNYILPKFGRRCPETLNRIEIENWLIGLKKEPTGKPLSNQTKNHILVTFRTVLREMQREGIVQYNCLADTEGFIDDSKPRDIFTKQDIQLLFPDDALELERIWGQMEYAYLFYILLATGMRVGEGRALQWKHVIHDEKRNGLFIEQAVKANGEIGTTKTGKSRVVILTKRAERYLNDWYETTPFDEPEDFIFFGRERNNALSATPTINHFKKALVNAGVLVNGRKLVIHSFRHTYNTRLKPLVPKETLQAMTGHSTDEMTERYNHPDMMVEYRKLLDYESFIDSLD